MGALMVIQSSNQEIIWGEEVMVFQLLLSGCCPPTRERDMQKNNFVPGSKIDSSWRLGGGGGGGGGGGREREGNCFSPPHWIKP